MKESLRLYGPFALVVVVLVGIFTTFSHAGGQRELDWTTLITSEDEVERQEAARVIRADTGRVIELLLTVVNSPVRKGEPFYTSSTSRNVAIRLLGQLRAREAVPVLVPWLSPRPGQTFGSDEELMFSRAGYALVEIGLPAIQPLLGVLRKEGCSSTEVQEAIIEGTSVRFQPEKLNRSSPLGDQCLKIIVSILGGQHTQLLLQSAIKEEAAQERKQNLGSAMELLASPKIPERLKQGGLLMQP